MVAVRDSVRVVGAAGPSDADTSERRGGENESDHLESAIALSEEASRSMRAINSRATVVDTLSP
jgi:hypothetical protein